MDFNIESNNFTAIRVKNHIPVFISLLVRLINLKDRVMNTLAQIICSFPKWLQE